MLTSGPHGYYYGMTKAGLLASADQRTSYHSSGWKLDASLFLTQQDKRIAVFHKQQWTFTYLKALPCRHASGDQNGSASNQAS